MTTVETRQNEHRTYERFTAFLLLFVGIVYLALWIISIFSETASMIKVENDKISISKSDVLSHLRTLIIISFSIVGGLLILRRKRPGWMMGIIVLTLLLIICSGAVYQSIKLSDKSLIIIAGIAWSVLFIASLVLIMPRTLKKFSVNNTTLIFTFALAILAGLFYFFVQ